MQLDFLKPREKFLILEISDKKANGLFMSVDDDRNIILEKLTEHVPLKKILGSPKEAISQKSWEGQHFFKSRRKIIAIADSTVATTIPIPLDLRRETSEGKEKITLGELENLIAQAMARIFNQCRSEAGRRLKIDELDTILVGAKVSHTAINGKWVKEPIGRNGKKISLILELTFATRRSFEELKQCFNSPDGFFFVESAQARLENIARVRPLPLTLIVTRPDSSATSFILEKSRDGYPVLYRETIDWNFSSLGKEIAAAFALTPEAAEVLYAAYLAGAMSEGAGRHFEKVIEPSILRFFSEVSRAKLKGRIYVDAPQDLPLDLPYRHAGTIFESIPLHEVMENLGFTTGKTGLKINHRVASRYLAPFLEAYFEKDASEINRKLRRRLHWLTE